MNLIHFRKIGFFNRLVLSLFSSINFISNVIVFFILISIGSYALIIAFFGIINLIWIFHILYSESKLYIFKIINNENGEITIIFSEKDEPKSININVKNLIIEPHNTGPGLTRSTNLKFYDGKDILFIQSCCGEWDHYKLNELSQKLKVLGSEIRI